MLHTISSLFRMFSGDLHRFADPWNFMNISKLLSLHEVAKVFRSVKSRFNYPSGIPQTSDANARPGDS